MPPPLTWSRAAFHWQPDPLTLVLALTGVVLYAAGVQRIRRSGRSWPLSRTLCFGGGIAVLAAATMSGLAAYENVLFSVHMIQHMLLAMVAPLLLSLSAPVTLLLGASGPVGRRRVKRVLGSPLVRVVGHPAIAWLLFVGTPFVLYFSPLLELSLRNGLVHALVHAHFVITGSLYLVGEVLELLNLSDASTGERHLNEWGGVKSIPSPSGRGPG